MIIVFGLKRVLGAAMIMQSLSKSDGHSCSHYILSLAKGKTKAYHGGHHGFLDGVALDLANFLAGFKKIGNGNGYSDSGFGLYANGIGCLAAQFVATVKKDTGEVYLEGADCDPGEFAVDVMYDDHTQQLTIWARDNEWQTEEMTIANFKAFCEANQPDNGSDVPKLVPGVTFVPDEPEPRCSGRKKQRVV